MKNIRKGTREAEKALKLVREGGGGCLTQRFSCQQHHGPSTKKRFVREIKGKELRRKSLNSHMHKINEEHASEDVRHFKMN